MKFSEIAKGTSAERVTSFRFHGQDVKVIFRPLSALEETDAAAAGIRYAKAKGASPEPGPVYDAAFMAHTLCCGCLDPDSPPDARLPFFDKGADQILADLDTDTIAQLFEQQQMWQEECSPSTKAKSVAELFDLAKAVAADADPLGLAYARLSPRTRWTLQRFTANLLVESHVFKPSPSSSSAETPPNAGKQN